MNQPNGIIGIGISLPEEKRTNDWWPASFRQRFDERARKDVTTPEVFLGRARTAAQRIQFEQMLEHLHDPFRGAIERRIAPPGTLLSTLDVQAARMACERAQVDPAEIDLIFTYSLPSDVCSLANAGIIQAALGARKAQAIGLDTACASFLTGLGLADAMISAGQARRALIVCSGLYSRLLDWDDPQSVNFGDGSAAAIVAPVPEGGFEAHASLTMGELHRGISMGPRSGAAWFDADGPLYLMSADLERGRQIVLNAADYAKATIETALRRAGREAAEVTRFYAHQPSVFFVESCKRAAGLGHTETVDTFRQFASIGPANIPINLFHAQQAGQLRRGDRVVLYACGAGTTLAATVLRWAA